MPQPKNTGSGSDRPPSPKPSSAASRKPAARRASSTTKPASRTRSQSPRGKAADAGKAAPAKPVEDAAPASDPDAPSLEQLRRMLDPLGLVVLTRERIQEAMDDAVTRGRMTRDDASTLVTELLSSGRRQTEDLLADVEQLLGRSRDQVEGAVSKQADVVLRGVDRARRAAGIGPAFPIVNYDDLTVAQVTDRIGDLTPAELRKVRDYERRNQNRKSVLQALESALG